LTGFGTIFLEEVLQHCLLQRQVRHQALELKVLFPQILQFTRLRARRAAILPFSAIEALLRDPVLTQQIRDWRTGLSLLQEPGKVFDRKALPLHDKTSVP
jgi:hypothetical protein